MDDERETKENLVAGDLLKLMSNNKNLCSNEYIEDVARLLPPISISDKLKFSLDPSKGG